VTHIGQELALGAGGGLGCFLGLLELVLCLSPLGDIPIHALYAADVSVGLKNHNLGNMEFVTIFAKSRKNRTDDIGD
jgi:hypothetical protein